MIVRNLASWLLGWDGSAYGSFGPLDSGLDLGLRSERPDHAPKNLVAIEDEMFEGAADMEHQQARDGYGDVNVESAEKIGVGHHPSLRCNHSVTEPQQGFGPRQLPARSGDDLAGHDEQKQPPDRIGSELKERMLGVRFGFAEAKAPIDSVQDERRRRDRKRHVPPRKGLT